MYGNSLTPKYLVYVSKTTVFYMLTRMLKFQIPWSFHIRFNQSHYGGFSSDRPVWMVELDRSKSFITRPVYLSFLSLNKVNKWQCRNSGSFLLIIRMAVHGCHFPVSGCYDFAQNSPGLHSEEGRIQKIVVTKFVTKRIVAILPSERHLITMYVIYWWAGWYKYISLMYPKHL